MDGARTQPHASNHRSPESAAQVGHGLPDRWLRPRPFARAGALTLLVLGIVAYYFWTVGVPFEAMLEVPPRGYPETDHFNYQSRGFLKGHLHLDVEPPAALLQAKNPYDPASRGNVQVLHDSSLYRGKYYIYFGPAPVVSLFLPFRALTGRDLPLTHASWVFCSGAFLAIAAILLLVQRRHFPAASTWSVLAGLLAIGGGGLIVALLRRANVWEVAAASGLFYSSVAMLCLVLALHTRHAVRWSLLGGLALGMAVASRPTYIVCSPVFALPLLFRGLRSSNGESGYGWPALFGAAAGCTAIVLGLFAYNYARFENPLEFGQKYQLSGIIEGDARHFSVSYISFNFRVYFLSALRWTGAFPFHDGVAVPQWPPGHGGYEYSIGLLANLPFSWLGVAGIFAVVRRASAPSLRATCLAIGAAACLQAGILLCYFGSCIRYMADFTPWFMLLAAFGLLALEATIAPGFTRVALRISGFVLAVFSTAAAGLAVVNLYHFTSEMLPPGYRQVARAMNAPVLAYHHRRWSGHEPTELVLSLPADRTARQEILFAFTRGKRRTAEVFIEYLPEGTDRFGYRDLMGGTLVMSSTVSPSIGADHRFKFRIGHEGPDYDGHRLRLLGEFDGRPLWNAHAVSLRTYPATLVRVRDGGFTGQIHSMRAIAATDFAAPKMGGARFRISVHPGMHGRAFPLLVSGRPEAGDFLTLRVDKDGRIAFGYDHWGAPGLVSPSFVLQPGQPHVVECWLPAANAPAAPQTKTSPLIVKLNGAVAWQPDVSHHPATAETLYIGRNPIGGTACEPALEGAILEATELPPPR